MADNRNDFNYKTGLLTFAVAVAFLLAVILFVFFVTRFGIFSVPQ